MSVKHNINLEECTAIDIIEYYGNVIGNSFEDVMVKLFNIRISEKDEQYMDRFVKQLNITEAKEAKNVRKILIYNLIQQSGFNNDRNVKLKVLYEIYTRYYKELNKKENAKKMKTIKDLIFDDNDALIITLYDKGRIKYDIISRDEPKSLKNISNEQMRDLLEVSLDNIVAFSDLNQIVKYPSLASNITRKCLIDLLYEIGLKNKDVEGIIKTDVFKSDNRILEIDDVKAMLNNEQVVDILNYYVIQFLKENIHLVDTELLFKNAIARLILGIRINNGEDINEIELKDDMPEEERIEALKVSIEYLSKFYKELLKISKGKDIEYQIYKQDGGEILKIDLEYIEEFIKRCSDDKYYTDEDIENIHNRVKSGILPTDKKVWKIANIDKNDLANVSRSYDIEESNENKEKILACGLEIIKYLKETGEISNNEQILELYLNGYINIDIIQSLEVPEFSEEKHIEKFKELYEATIQDKEIIHMEKFARYTELYKRLLDENKLDKDSLVENLVEQYGEESGNKILIDLYNTSMINLEDCINWAGTDVLNDLFETENRSIQPNQINQLYHNKTLSLNDIANLILRIPNREERYITIASIFPEVSEGQERQELLYRTIDVDKTISKSEKTGKYNREKRGGYEYNKNITDSTYRFNLIRLFDKNYFMEMTADGHAIIKLPKFKKVMIEKMLDTKKEEGYGSATYILDEEYYTINESAIKQEGKINRKNLISAFNALKADRFSHIVDRKSNEKEEKKTRKNTWGEQLKRYFTEMTEGKYTEEEIETIEIAIENIGNSIRKVGVVK